MFSKTTLLALAAASAVQASAPQGFNYGSTMNGQGRSQQDFETDFAGAQKLQGAPGTFNSARLYTMIDGLDATKPISALQAAQKTNTQLLLGLWMSGTGQDAEISALKAALQNTELANGLSNLILGISVGSEDLYRISPTGLAAPDAAPGNGPDVIVKYIKQVRDAIKGTPWANVPVGHVDTWTAWVNGSNSAVIDNSDFLGVDAYPYWQNTEANAVSNGAGLFNEAMSNTKGVSNGKPVWITETGWAVSGPTEGQAVAGDNEAQQYWDDVACPNLGNTPTFWYTLYDGIENDPKTPSFSVANQTSQGFVPRFDLSCSGHTSNTTSSDNSTSTGSSSSSTSTGSSSSGSAPNGTYTGSPSQPSGTSSSGSSGSGSSGSSSSGSSSSGSGSSSSGSGSSSTGSGSGASGTTPSGAKNSTAAISTTNGASSLTYSLGSMAALAAAVVALL